jgi:predicted Rossmann-fold nucleotide-binding protein
MIFAERGADVLSDDGEEDHHFQRFYPDIARARLDLQVEVGRFLERTGSSAIVGILGGSDENMAEARKTIADFLRHMRGARVAILSGGTRGGLPQAAEEARFLGFPTIGVYPQGKEEHVLFEELDLAIAVPAPLTGLSCFGSETPTLVQLSDAVVVIGGGVGTLAEVATILKINKTLLRKGRKPIYVCPVYQTGGVANYLTALPGVEQLKSCFPSKRIYNGAEAAAFIKEKLAGCEPAPLSDRP